MFIKFDRGMIFLNNEYYWDNADKLTLNVNHIESMTKYIPLNPEPMDNSFKYSYIMCKKNNYVVQISIDKLNENLANPLEK